MTLILYKCSSETSVAVKDEDFDTPLQLKHNSFIIYKSLALHNPAHISL